MPEATRTLLRTIEGPKGRAEIVEVLQSSNSEGAVDGEVVEYEVVFNDKKETVRSLGEASLAAEDFVRGR